jgi:hypothetical protein
MTLAIPRRPLPVVGLVLGLLLAACGGGPPSASLAPASPSAATSPSASAPASAIPSEASATPSPVAATATPAGGPSTAACQPLPQEGILPTDRLTDLRLDRGATSDRLTFVFGNPSLPGGPTPPQGSLDVGRPPYSQAGSGQAIEMAGEHVLVLRFSGMSLANDVGQPTYDGPVDLKPRFAALKHVVLFDASEGQIGWYIGYDGPGCVTLGRNGQDVTITIAHA